MSIHILHKAHALIFCKDFYIEVKFQIFSVALTIYLEIRLAKQVSKYEVRKYLFCKCDGKSVRVIETLINHYKAAILNVIIIKECQSKNDLERKM